MPIGISKIMKKKQIIHVFMYQLAQLHQSAIFGLLDHTAWELGDYIVDIVSKQGNGIEVIETF